LAWRHTCSSNSYSSSSSHPYIFHWQLKGADYNRNHLVSLTLAMVVVVAEIVEVAVEKVLCSTPTNIYLFLSKEYLKHGHQKVSFKQLNYLT